MRTILVLTLAALAAACSAPAGEPETETSAAALSSSVKLEKSRIEVLLDQKNTGTSPTDCFVEFAVFRITYANPTLPAGTKITLHAGESYSDQGWVGDGFGWGNWSKGIWGKLRDLPMSEAGGTYTVDTTAEAYVQYASGQYYWGMPGPITYAPELAFVFHIELPDGTSYWDNRLRQDYWVSGNGPACAGTTGGFVSRAVWGPF